MLPCSWVWVWRYWEESRVSEGHTAGNPNLQAWFTAPGPQSASCLAHKTPNFLLCEPATLQSWEIRAKQWLFLGLCMDSSLKWWQKGREMVLESVGRRTPEWVRKQQPGTGWRWSSLMFSLSSFITFWFFFLLLRLPSKILEGNPTLST